MLKRKRISRGKENQTSSMTGTQQANIKARAAHSHTHTQIPTYQPYTKHKYVEEHIKNVK